MIFPPTLFLQALLWSSILFVVVKSDVPNQTSRKVFKKSSSSDRLTYLPFLMMSHLEKARDTADFWRDTEILSLVEKAESEIDYVSCERTDDITSQVVNIPSSRSVQPVCRSSADYQLCPQCAHFSNKTICELFRDNCKERKVRESERRTYCDNKYGPWRAMLLPADVAQCRCCDECVFYRELDQSCMQDEYYFENEEFLPVTTIDFRAGCNQYWGHPEQDFRALRCDKILRRCVPVNVPSVPSQAMRLRRNFRFDPPTNGADCPINCAGYKCPGGEVKEGACEPGAFLPDKNKCNCCGTCSAFQQLNQKCANYKKTVVNESGGIEVEEEFLEPGCDDGLVCRQTRCQDVHAVQTYKASRREMDTPYEPCKSELKFFKKKYGPEGHLHHEAPQCTPLWLYAAVQCRRFVCYCALEDGERIEGINVPRAEVSNMNCDCAREKCRAREDIECDGYGNYQEVLFTQLDEQDDADLEADGFNTRAARDVGNVVNTYVMPEK